MKAKAEIIKYLKDSFAFGHKSVATLNSSNLVEPITSGSGRPTTRLFLATFAAAHCFDHYGQMIEYLRMNGIVPPASRGIAGSNERVSIPSTGTLGETTQRDVFIEHRTALGYPPGACPLRPVIGNPLKSLIASSIRSSARQHFARFSLISLIFSPCRLSYPSDVSFPSAILSHPCPTVDAGST